MGACSSCSSQKPHPQTTEKKISIIPPLGSPSVKEVQTIGRGVSRRGSTFVQAAEVTGKVLPTGITTGMHTVSPLREGFDPMLLEPEYETASPRLQRQLSKRSAEDLIELDDLERPSLGTRKPSERSSLRRQPTKIEFEDGVSVHGRPEAEELQPLKIVFDLASPRLSDEALELHGVARAIDEGESRAEAIADEVQCLQLLQRTAKDTSQLLLVRGILRSSKWETNEAVMIAGYNELLRLGKSQNLIDWMAEWGLVLGLVDFAINPVFSHLKSALVQEKFCAVLALFCEKLGDEGVLQLNKTVHALIMALRYHPHSLGVQKFGITALASVVRGDSNAESQTNQFLVVAMGGIELVCAALNYFTVEGPQPYANEEQEVVSDAPPPSREECRALQTAGVAALCVFSNNASFHKQMIEACAVTAVLHAVRHHGDFLALKIRSLVFMHNMCEKGDVDVVRKIWLDVGLGLPTLLSEAPEEKELDEQMREELTAVRDSLASALEKPLNLVTEEPCSSPSALDQS